MLHYDMDQIKFMLRQELKSFFLNTNSLKPYDMTITQSDFTDQEY